MGKALARLAREAVTAESAVLLFRAAKGTPVETPSCWKKILAISSMEIHLFAKDGRPVAGT